MNKLNPKVYLSQMAHGEYENQNGCFDVLTIKYGPYQEVCVYNVLEDLVGIFSKWEEAKSWCDRE